MDTFDKGLMMIVIFLILTLLALLAIGFVSSKDSTDKSVWERSGLTLYKDHGTGCEYLSLSRGVFGKEKLIPRLDKNGKHLCD